MGRRVYVETTTRSPLATVWERTQHPGQHAPGPAELVSNRRFGPLCGYSGQLHLRLAGRHRAPGPGIRQAAPRRDEART